MTYTKKTINEISNNILLNLIQNVDAINDANVGSVLSTLITSLSQEFAEQYDDMDTIYKGTVITTANGEDLDNIGAIVGVSRGAGDDSEGYVTFMRNNPATTDFTISQGTYISTQPNTGETVYQFMTNADTIFKTSIVDEERTFIDGIYEYDFDERLINSITSLTGTGGPFTENTDYSLSKDYDSYIIDTETYVLLDDCEAITGWTAVGADTGVIATSVTHYQGTKSLDLTKSGGTITDFAYTKTLGTPVDLEEKDYEYVSLYTSTDFISKVDSIKLILGSGGSNTHSYEIEYNTEDLTADSWNRLVLDITNNNTVINGNPKIDLINYLEIKIELNNFTDTVTTGNLLMDFWFGANKKDYNGTISQWDRTATIPTSSTTVTTTYVPLSKDVLCTATNVGEGYNVAKDKIIYKVSNLPNVDSITNYLTFQGGIDIEKDEAFRNRIVHASDLANKATASAIEANVNALNYVKSVSINNMPEESTTDETHTFDNSVNKYSLCNKVPIDDSTLDVKGTLAAATGHTFVNGVDYILNSDSEIEFNQGGDDPDNNTVTYNTYNYNKLGHFDLLIAGELGNLTTSQNEEIVDTIDDTISVGVTYTVNQPTYTPINVTVTLVIDSSYNSTAVKSNVEDSIKDYIKALEIGDDILLAGVINVAMDIPGVDNMVVNDIAGGGSNDYVIASNQIGVVGTIIVN